MSIERYFPIGTTVDGGVEDLEARLDGLDGISDIGDAGTNRTVTAGNGNGGVKLLALNEPVCTFTFNRGVLGQASHLVLVLTQDATGGRLATWPASVLWPAGAAPVLSTAPGAVDLVSFVSYDDGTSWFGDTVGQDYS